ncbi:hypothetical protein [Leptospira mayottensis]|uniref:hypothetical protein n=1 Tax=Leptospira mayottensis TaxID=1137606 RepID=UPI001F15E384|nr:hypothetical protein [Leptospira mayottensis]
MFDMRDIYQVGPSTEHRCEESIIYRPKSILNLHADDLYRHLLLRVLQVNRKANCIVRSLVT